MASAWVILAMPSPCSPVSRCRPVPGLVWLVNLSSVAQQMGEVEFRKLIRELASAGQYPEHRTIAQRLGRGGDQMRSGLSEQQTRWRRDELAALGYDWEASRKAHALVRQQK
jgi:hypothetical protein